MTINLNNVSGPVVYSNTKGLPPYVEYGNNINYRTDHKYTFNSRGCTNAAKQFVAEDVFKYPLPKSGFSIKLAALKKLEPKAVPLIVTIDDKHQTHVHAYHVNESYYFLYDVMGISHREDSKLYKQFGFPVGDILFNCLLKKYGVTQSLNIL
jgi:hypothetical protein